MGSESNGNRIEWLDAARGLAVLLVIWGHIDNGSMLTKSFYCFHIPLLFWISGFLFSLKNKTSKMFLCQKVRTIAIPCVVNSTLVVLIGIFFFRNDMYYSLIPQIVLQIRSWPIWYMACLFILNIMGYAVIQLENRMQRLCYFRIAICIFSVLIGLIFILEKIKLPWNIDIAFMAFPFFYMGYIEKTNYKMGGGKVFLSKLSENSKWKIYALLLVLLSMAIGFGNKILSGAIYTLDMYSGNYNNVVLSYVSAVLGIYGICIICSNIRLSILAHIGKRSMVYFAFHFNVFIPLIMKSDTINSTPHIIRSPIVFLLTCILAEVSYSIISKLPCKSLLGIK